jgi:multiple sugar transport system permease protein
MSAMNDSVAVRPNSWDQFRSWWHSKLENQTVLGYGLMIPTMIIVFGLIGYPFVLSIFFSMTDKVLAKQEYSFVGLENYISLLKDPIFRRTIWNTFNYTVTAVIFKVGLGLLMALLLNELRHGRRFFRAAFLLPWVIPSSLSILAWVWMFDSQFSIITYVLRELGIVDGKIPWLGKPALAMAAVQTVNIWRGAPFFGMIILAGLVTVPQELYDAATVDGSTAWQRFRYVTFPHILPILIVSTLFSFVRTLGDFEIVWILTKGGPINSTHLVSTLAFRTAIQGADMSKGSAIAAFLFPFLVVIIALQLRDLRRR